MAKRLNQEERRPWSVQYAVIPKGRGFVQNLMDGELKLESLTHETSAKELEAVVVTAEPGVSCWEGKLTPGGKWYHMLEGTLEILVNEESYLINKGDSLFVETDVSHIWRNPGADTARALVLSTQLPQTKKGDN